MSRFEALAGLLAGLKGAPATVLWAMALAGRPLSQRELVFLTGYSEKPVRLAIGRLLEQGIIQREGPDFLSLAVGWPELPPRPGNLTVVSPKSRRRPAGDEPEAGQLADESPPTLPAANPVEITALVTGKYAETAGEEAAESPATMAGASPIRMTTHMTGESARTAGESSGERSEDAGAGQVGRNDGRNSRNDSRIGVTDVVVDDLDLDLDQEDQQQQPEAPAGARPLVRLLKRMGIHGRAFQRLVNRDDLAERPEVVLAWWWYYRAQEGVRNPAGAAIARLDGGEEPPNGYLALARAWPGLPPGTRQELESLHQHHWSAEQIAATLQPAYPGLTAGAIRAYMALYLEAPLELENGG